MTSCSRWLNKRACSKEIQQCIFVPNDLVPRPRSRYPFLIPRLHIHHYSGGPWLGEFYPE